KHTGVSRADFSTTLIDERAVKSIPYMLGKRHCAVPIHFKDDRELVVAMNDPMDLIAQDDLELATGKKIHPVIAGKKEINTLLESYFNNEYIKKAAQEFSAESLMKEEEIDKLTLDEVSNAPVVRLVNSI